MVPKFNIAARGVKTTQSIHFRSDIKLLKSRKTGETNIYQHYNFNRFFEVMALARIMFVPMDAAVFTHEDNKTYLRPEGVHGFFES